MTNNQTINRLIEPNSRVLDLGCGGGELLKLLAKQKNVLGIGVEKSDDKIFECIRKGISVHHGNIDDGLVDYRNQSFDYVILSETLQEVSRPSLVMQEMLRVGKRAIVTFPNFGHWRVRWQVLYSGNTPMTPNLPYHWYETPNIQYCSVNDFIEFCNSKHYQIEESIYFTKAKKINILPNLFAESALFLITNNTN
jgi:methionine biosynthesis protein MetW